MSQTDAILADLIAGAQITPQDALRKHRCMRLAAVIHTLREDGFRITGEIVTVKRRGGHKVTFARYQLLERRRARSLIAKRARARAATTAPASRQRGARC